MIGLCGGIFSATIYGKLKEAFMYTMYIYAYTHNAFMVHVSCIRCNEDRKLSN